MPRERRPKSIGTRGSGQPCAHRGATIGDGPFFGSRHVALEETSIAADAMLMMMRSAQRKQSLNFLFPAEASDFGTRARLAPADAVDLPLAISTFRRDSALSMTERQNASPQPAVVVSARVLLYRLLPPSCVLARPLSCGICLVDFACVFFWRGCYAPHCRHHGQSSVAATCTSTSDYRRTAGAVAVEISVEFQDLTRAQTRALA